MSPTTLAPTASSSLDRGVPAALRRTDPGPCPAQPTAQAIVEVLVGQRPANQLTRLTTPTVHSSISRRAQATARRARGPLRPMVVRRVMVCEPAAGVAEVAAVIQQARGRMRAMALRMEIRNARWVVTQLTIG